MNVVTQLTQFVGCDVIDKNTTDLAVCCATGSAEFSWVELSCVAINTPLVYHTEQTEKFRWKKELKNEPKSVHESGCMNSGLVTALICNSDD